jgi:hypothetical protein
MVVLSFEGRIAPLSNDLLASLARHGVMVSAVILVFVFAFSFNESQGSMALLLAAESLRGKGTVHQVLSLWERSDDLFLYIDRLFVFVVSL